MTLWDFLHAWLAARRAEKLSIDQMIANTQRDVSRFTVLMIALVLVALFLIPSIDPSIEKLLYVVLGGLLNIWATQNTFWFGRPRGGGIPDPALNTTVQTTTTVTTDKTPPQP